MNLGYTVSDALRGGKDTNMNRRGHQRGTILRRGNRWALKYRKLTISASGELSYKQTTVALGDVDQMTRKAARAAADQIVIRANDRAAAPASLATFDEFVEVRFLPEWVAKKRPSGRAHYEYLLGLIRPTLGHYQLAEITPAVVQGLLNTFSKTYSKQTVVHIRNVISKVLSYARLLGMVCGVLPTADVVCTGREAKVVQALTADQFAALVAAVPFEYQTLVRFVGLTGMRIGEALGLCWDAVNLTSGPAVRCGHLAPPMTVVVARSFSRGQYGAPKTSGSIRIVPLTSALVDALRAIQQPEGPVFRSRAGTPYDAHNLASRVLKPAGEAIGCPWVHWHSLRHTLASRLNVDIAARQKVLGHMSPAMTVRYTHPEVERVREAMEVIQ